MHILSVILFLLVPLAFGLGIYGLFNRKRSIPCIIAGVLMALIALPGALHAWGEGRSVPWTAVYLTIMLIGIISVIRQLMPRKPHKEDE